MRPAIKRYFDMSPETRQVATEGAALLWLSIKQETPEKCLAVYKDASRKLQRLYPNRTKCGKYVKIARRPKRRAVGVRINFSKALAALITIAGGSDDRR